MYVVEACRGGMSWRYVVDVRRGGMSWRYVVEACRGCMSWRYVVEACRGGMSWKHVVDVCRGYTHTICSSHTNDLNPHVPPNDQAATTAPPGGNSV